MERIYAFLPSILIIACIAGATLLYMKWVIKHFGDNFKSVEWHKQNQWKVSWTVSTPLIYVWAPAVEEIVFRAPLIIAFSAMSSVAWYGVFASSGLFALLHWFGKKIWIPEILSAKENGNHKSDDMEAEINRLHMEEGKMIMVYKVLHVVFALPVGILAGYYGIKYQSIWVAVGFHSAWSLIPLLPLMLTVSVVWLAHSLLAICMAAMLLYDKLTWKRRRRSMWKPY